MKFTPEVIAALAVLHEHAENDFERHRLDVLERDLTNPPTVEIVDDTHQKFEGIIFRKNKDGHYFCGFAIHRAVWSYYHGQISEGYEIHHLNHNKGDNTISNLQLLTNFAHQRIHHLKPPIEKICPICGKKFTLKRRDYDTVCCSYACGMIWRDRNKKPVEKICPVCGKNFVVPHWSKKIFCSNVCSGIAKRGSHRVPIVEITCAHCGKNFSAPFYYRSKKYCSANCYHDARRKNNRKATQQSLSASPNNHCGNETK